MVSFVPHPNASYSCGCDVARFGQDSSVIIITEKHLRKDTIKVVYVEEIKHSKTTEVVGKLALLDVTFNFEKIYIDETGLGGGVVDMISEELGTNKVEGITFTVQSKEDIYSNLKKLMEQGKLKIPNCKKLVYQLINLKYEIMSSGHIKIHHPENQYDDFADSLALSCFFWKDVEEKYEPFIF